MSDPTQEKQKNDEKQYVTEWTFSFAELGGKIDNFVKSLGVQGEELIKTETFDEPVGEATHAKVSLHTPVGRTNVHAGTAVTLVHAEITHVGEVQFTATGTTEKQVTISQRTEPSSWMRGIFSWLGSTDKLRWNVALSPSVPLDLDIHSGIGECQYDLSALQLTSLNIHGGTGEMHVTLPTTRDVLRAVVNGGVGEVNIRIPAGASVDLQARAGTGEIDVEIGSGAAVNADIKGGVGETKVRVPAGAAVRVTANMGVGDIAIPSDFVTVRGQAGGGFGRNGVWQTANFETAATKIDLRFDGGVGALKIWR